MPRAERDPKQPGVYRIVESDEERYARLEKQDLLARLEALEKRAEESGHKVPEPPKGFVRTQVSQQ